MNMWADALPNNSFTSCKLLIDVQEHRYHPYRFRSTNRIQQTVSYTVSKAHSEKKYLFTRSLCGITKIPLETRNGPSRPGTGKASRHPREAGSGRWAGTTKQKGGSRGLTPDGSPQGKYEKGTFRESRKGLDQKIQRKNAAARYSPTPSRVQYHRRSQALASGFGKGPGVSPGP